MSEHGEQDAEPIAIELTAAVGQPVGLVRVPTVPGRTEVFAVPALDAFLKVYRAHAASKSLRERLALAHLGRHGLLVPRVLASGVLSDGAPWLLTARVAGEPGDTIASRVEPDARDALYEDVGALLAQLHAVPPYAPEDVPPHLARPPAERYAALRAHVLAEPGDDDAVFARAARTMVALEASRTPARPCLVHGDYGLRNLVCDAGPPPRLVAVLDFERAGLGDPYEDLAGLALQEFHRGPGVAASIARGYFAGGAPPPGAAAHLAYHRLGLAFEVATWARDADPAFYARALAAAARLADDPLAAAWT